MNRELAVIQSKCVTLITKSINQVLCAGALRYVFVTHMHTIFNTVQMHSFLNNFNLFYFGFELSLLFSHINF